MITNMQIARDMFSEALTELIDGVPLLISFYGDKDSMSLNVSRETLGEEDGNK